MSTQYNKGGYSVNINNDGTILVKNGDSLSKYSMAIYGNFNHMNTFLRKTGGILQPIVNVNMIYTGETLYHKPSIPKNGIPGNMPPIGTPTEIDVDQIIKDYGLPKSMKEQISWYVDKGKYATGFVSLIGTLEIAALSGLAVSGFVGPLLAIFGGCFALYQARNRGMQNAAMRGSVYGVTSWAFDLPVPQLPRTLEIALKNAALTDSNNELQETKINWNQMVQTSRSRLETFCKNEGADKQALKRYYQSQSITYGGNL